MLQDIKDFSEKLKDAKFAEFSTLSNKQMEELDKVLNSDIPKLMEVCRSVVVFPCESCGPGLTDFLLLCCHILILAQELPSERDSPETLRAKMGSGNATAGAVPVPSMTAKFGKKSEQLESNPFGYSAEDTDHYW